MGFLNLSDPPPTPKRVLDYDSPSPTLTLGQRIERDLKESPPRGWSRTYLFLLIALVLLLVSLLRPAKKYDVQERLAHTLARLSVKDQVKIGADNICSRKFVNVNLLEAHTLCRLTVFRAGATQAGYAVASAAPAA